MGIILKQRVAAVNEGPDQVPRFIANKTIRNGRFLSLVSIQQMDRRVMAKPNKAQRNEKAGREFLHVSAKSWKPLEPA